MDQRRTSSMSSRVSPLIFTSRQPDPGSTRHQGHGWRGSRTSAVAAPAPRE